MFAVDFLKRKVKGHKRSMWPEWAIYLKEKLETLSTDNGDKYPGKELLTGAKH